MRKRYAKGIISIALALIMVIIPNVSVFAGSEQIYGNIKVRMIEENSEYSKMEIIHLDTGEIEYLESFYYNGEIRHIAKGEGVVQEIISKNDKIYISENGELIQILDLNVENLLIKNNELYAGHSLNDFNISPNAWGAWSAPYWTTGSKSVNVGILSGVIGVIATVLGVPAGYSVAITIGTTLYNAGAKNVYYKIKTRTRYDKARQLYEMEKTTYMYQHSNFTGYLGSHSDRWTGSATN